MASGPVEGGSGAFRWQASDELSGPGGRIATHDGCSDAVTLFVANGLNRRARFEPRDHRNVGRVGPSPIIPVCLRPPPAAMRSVRNIKQPLGACVAHYSCVSLLS